MSKRAWVYILGVLITGAALAIVALTGLTAEDLSEHWQTLLILVFLATLAQLFKAETPDHQLYYTTLVFFFAGVVLLPPGFIVLLAIVPHLVEWIRERLVGSPHLRDWYLQPFNISVHIIAGLAAKAIYVGIAPAPFTRLTLNALLAPLLAAVTYNIINHLLIGLALVLARGVSWRESGILDVSNLSTDLVLLLSGEVLAVLWQINPWLSFLALTPLVLIYRAMTIPLLERQAQTDAKTGAWNAGYFNNSLEDELARAHRFDRPLSLVMGDLDLLRRINNRYGHLAGDVVLQGVADTMRDLARDYDVVARFGGEEFAVLMPETTLREARARAELIREAIANADFAVPTSVEPLHATISMGVAERRPDESAESLVHRADVALYQAKDRGRNLVCTYEEIERGTVPELPSDGYPLTTRTSSDDGAFADDALEDDDAKLVQKVITDRKPVSTTTADERGVVRTYPPWALQAYVAGLAVLASVIALLLLPGGGPVDVEGLLLFAVLALGVEALSVEIYAEDTTISTSAAPYLGGVILFGAVGAIIMAPIIAIVSFVRQRAPINRLVFNMSNHLLGGLSVALLIRLSALPLSTLPLIIQLLFSVLAAVILYLVTTVLLTGAVVLDRGLSFRRVWTERFRWLWPYYVALGIVAYAFVFSYVTAGAFGLIVILVPLLMLRYSQTQYITRTENLVNQLRSTNLQLRRQTEEVELLNEELLLTLARATDLRDPHVMEHSKHVARYAALTAEELGLPSERIDVIRKAGLLHDIGKLGIPERILFKPAPLSEEEYRQVKAHVIVGAELVNECHSLRALIPMIKFHHEWFDGSGYPLGLAGEQIPLEARILALADAVEAMASDRPYQKARSASEILAEIDRFAGTQFDPEVVAAFNRVIDHRGPMVIVNSARNLELA